MKKETKTKDAKESTKIFAKGLCWQKLIIIFIIGCLFGNYYEMILNLVRHYLRDGSIFWEVRRGFIYFPLSPVYGAGAVLMTLAFAEKNYKWHQILVYGAVLGGSFEYIISFLQETFTGTVSWNYTKYPLDINGRTTIPIMILWGILCVIFIKLIYPYLNKIIEKIPYKIGNTIAKILIIIITLDAIISFTAVLRQTLRREGIKPITFIGEICDKIYTDERLKKAYPNMKIPKRNVKK